MKKSPHSFALVFGLLLAGCGTVSRQAMDRQAQLFASIKPHMSYQAAAELLGPPDRTSGAGYSHWEATTRDGRSAELTVFFADGLIFRVQNQIHGASNAPGYTSWLREKEVVQRDGRTQTVLLPYTPPWQGGSEPLANSAR